MPISHIIFTLRVTNYNIIKMKRLIYFMGLLALGMIIVSCEKEIESESIIEDKQEVVNVTGKWEVMVHNDSAAIFGPFELLTISETFIDNDSITIQDGEVKFWDFQVNASLNEKDGTFQTELSTCQICEEGVEIKIANGKIIDSDSIYFEIQFEDDITPFGRTYRMKGHRIKG